MERAIILLVFIIFWRCGNINAKEAKGLSINEEIRDKEIRVVDSDGSQLGIMSPADALKIAEGKGLDLVMIAPKAQPLFAKSSILANIAMSKQKKKKRQRKTRTLFLSKKFS